MSDATNPEQDDDLKPHDLRKQLEDANRAKAELEAQLNATRREMVFKEVGLDTSKGVGKLFAKVYDGEPTAEAVKAALESEGISLEASTEREPEVPKRDPIPDSEAQALGAISRTGSGEPVTEDPELDPEEKANRSYSEVMGETNNEDYARAAWLRTLLLEENAKLIEQD